MAEHPMVQSQPSMSFPESCQVNDSNGRRLARTKCLIYSHVYYPPYINMCAICRYALMIQCWSLVPADRPSFTTIHASLKDQQLEPHTDPGAVLVLSDDDDEEGTAL